MAKMDGHTEYAVDPDVNFQDENDEKLVDYGTGRGYIPLTVHGDDNDTKLKDDCNDSKCEDFEVEMGRHMQASYARGKMECRSDPHTFSFLYLGYSLMLEINMVFLCRS